MVSCLLFGRPFRSTFGCVSLRLRAELIRLGTELPPGA